MRVGGGTRRFLACPGRNRRGEAWMFDRGVKLVGS